jgi:hypothetical protein
LWHNIVVVKKYTKEEVLKFLRENPIMSAAMCGGSERPVATILLFEIGDNFTVGFATKVGTYKDKALKINPLMSMAVWKNKEMEVQMSGRASEVTDETELDALLDKLALSVDRVDGFWAPVLKYSGEYVCYKMKPDWIRVLDLSSDSISESESGFMEFNVES